MKDKMKRICSFVLFLLMMLLFYLIAFNELGIPKSKLEADAREHEDYFCVQDVNEDMAVLLFYSEDRNDHDFAFYENRDGLSFGYFFRAGGDAHEIQTGIAEFSLFDRNESRGYVSMNARKIVCAELSSGDTINLDEGEPFALVLKKGVHVTFLDADGNRVEPIEWQ